MPAGGIWSHNPSKRAASDPRLRPLGHWDRRSLFWCWSNIALDYGLAGVINVHSLQGMQYISSHPWFWECQLEVILTDGCNFVTGVAGLHPQSYTRVEYWRSDCLGRNTALGCFSTLCDSDTFRVCKSVHHRSFEWINQPNAAISQVYNLSFKYSSTF